jgi:hypothetical protein
LAVERLALTKAHRRVEGDGCATAMEWRPRAASAAHRHRARPAESGQNRSSASVSRSARRDCGIWS